MCAVLSLFNYNNIAIAFLVISHYIYCILLTLQLRKMSKQYKRAGKWAVVRVCAHTCYYATTSELYPILVRLTLELIV